MQIESINVARPVEIECDGYVPVVVRFGGYEGPLSWAPKYWRTGDFERSLVEVAVDPTSGAICKIVVTMLRGIQNKPLITRDLPEKSGIPIARLSQWDEDQKRVDVEQDVSGSLADQKLTVVFGDMEATSLEKCRCNRVTFLIGQSGDLRGFQVGNLSEQEVENIRYTIGDTSG